MTASSIIDPARFLLEHLRQASPDLLRDMLTTFFTCVPDRADLMTVPGSAAAPVGRPRQVVVHSPARQRPLRPWAARHRLIIAVTGALRLLPLLQRYQEMLDCSLVRR